MRYFLPVSTIFKRHIMKQIGKLFLLCILIGVGSLAFADKTGQITLNQGGDTDYQIVVANQPTSIDKMAVDELREFLKKSTGADFKVFQGSPASAADLQHRIFVGLSPAAIKVLGSDLSAELKDQEHIVKNSGNDIFLFGKGEYGNLYAVYSFLENQVGCRWYTAYGDMKIPFHSTLKLDSFDYKRGFAFPIRSVMNWFYKIRPVCDLFFYRNFQNQLLINKSSLPGLKPVYNEILPGVHTSFAYMPPGGPILPGNNPPPSWLKDKSFFSTNPDFYSMDENGKRVNNRQLCFGNPDLRRKLTEHIEKRLNEFGGKGIVSIDANDNGDKFCCCDGCKKLESKYKTPGGPLMDYLIEVCNYLKEKYPEAYIKTLAYRKGQTETPPAGIAGLPENLIVIFAPIEDNILAALSHTSNADTYNNLKKWCAISKHVWVWYYTNPYTSDNSVPPPPFANLERLVEDIKLIKEAGVEGTYFEHDASVALSVNFSELQTWLMLKLFQDPARDAASLIKEFTDYYYGTAATLMRQYISELESYRKELLAAQNIWKYCPQMSQYTYLNPENILKWEKMFDEMEKLAEKDTDRQFHVRLARMSLDVSAVANEKKLKGRYPEMKSSPAEIENRLKATYQKMLEQRMPGYKGDIFQWLEQTKLQPKPLPPQFDKIQPELLCQVNPNFPNKLHESILVKDPDAAWGTANFEKNDKKPFSIGFYDNLTKKSGISKSITESEISPDIYTFYKLGKITLTPNCRIWGGNWLIVVNLGHLYSIDEPSAEYDAYISLKFEGTAYSAASKNKQNQVLCDRVVLIKKLSSDALASGALDVQPSTPLPQEFKDIPAAQLRQINPNSPVRLPEKMLVKDNNAAWGEANFELSDKKLFRIGFYDNQSKKSGISKSINESEIHPDTYKFYRLGNIKLSPSCIIWGGSWLISVNLNHLYSKSEPDTEYEAYVSLKFEGPAYSTISKDKPNRVLCDRVVLIKKLSAAALASGALDVQPSIPLPQEFKDIPVTQLLQIKPDFPVALPEKLMVKDSDAAWGKANFEKNDQKPYRIGFYDYHAKKSGITKSINESEIAPDTYKFYKLGKIKLTPSCRIWGGRWEILVNLTHLYSISEPDTEYDAYISLKFEGPAYSAASKDKPNQVLCDRVLLIKKVQTESHN